MTSFIGNK